ncbi:MAG TPA: XdhC/CoxI family protein [Candidatus Dormibacteraeota bacterium]|nr:XdhC/CoxI family protein [Candidatus Dormibacteraeota bacterium]
MADVLEDILAWWASGATVGVGTVIETFRSAPRQPGAAMAVGPDASVVGSVSGGCVEGAVYEVARQVASSGIPVLERYGVSDDDAFAVGLTCGGILHVFVEAISQSTFPELGQVADSVRAAQPVSVATVVDGPAKLGARLCVWPDRRVGSLGQTRLDEVVTAEARRMLAQGRTGVLQLGPTGERLGGELTIFVASYSPAPRMLVYGAIDFAAAVARVGSFLGYRVTVCDARSVFATRRRFPTVDDLVVDWPHRHLASIDIDERTAICVLTHDPKFDIPLLDLALRSSAGYIGAMGSRRTHQDRLARLRDRGLTPQELDRLHSPIGLDIGASTPEETAISIAAEIIRIRWGDSGTALSRLTGRIHGAQEAAQFTEA